MNKANNARNIYASIASKLSFLDKNKIKDVMEAPKVRPRQSIEPRNKPKTTLFFFMIFFP